MLKTTRLLVATAALAVLTTLAGCGQDDGTASDDTTTQSPAPETTEPETPLDRDTDDADETEDPMAATEELTQAAITDLTERLDVAAEDVTVVSVEEVTWNDGSLGCAKPDMLYTQATVDGTRITLKVGDKEFAYHSGGGAAPAYCKKPTQ